MTRVETVEEIDENASDNIPLYEEYWAQNTTAHGVSRVVNTTRWHKAVWILALVGCFIYVTVEVVRSIQTYNLHQSTTEINKLNSDRIEFPAVTFCNFNRWRKSHMTKEVLAQLKEVLSLYSYDYVIPAINDGADPDKIPLKDLIAKPKIIKPKRKPQKVTKAAPVKCTLPPMPHGLTYQVLSGNNNVTNDTAELGTIIAYKCVQPNAQPRGGDMTHQCIKDGNDGSFVGTLPLCVNVEETGERYVLRNNASDRNAIAASNTVKSNYHGKAISNMTLCFWMKTMKSHNLGTILSYGVGDETIISIIQLPQTLSEDIYGVKYKLFGVEGRRLTLTSFGQWSPFCLQYAAKDYNSQFEGSLKLFKFLVFSSADNGFKQYGNDPVANTKDFPLNGNLVMFNEYQSYLNQQAGRPIEMASSGGEIANVNLWDRIVPVEVMNTMLWDGNIYSMDSQTVAALSGNILSSTVTFDVSVAINPKATHGGIKEVTSTAQETVQRRKREVETTQSEISQTTRAATSSDLTSDGETSSGTTNQRTAADSATTSSSSATSGNDSSQVNNTFNYAKFTRSAGWQLVDAFSNHSFKERNTLLSCTFRGRSCDSRWFTHRFGAYGNCYTFNQDIPSELGKNQKFNLPLMQDSSGPTGGLNMLLDLQTWEYAESTALNGNSELGIKFIVHAPYETPVINSQGYAAAPGQKAFVGFSKTTIDNLYEPWGRCDPGLKLDYSDTYTVNGCAIECRLHKVVAVCSCKPYYYPGDFDVCSVSQLAKCAYKEIAKVNADFGNQCHCPIACHSEEFDVKLSYATFPNQPYGLDLGKQLNMSLPPTKAGIPSYDSQSQYIRANVVNMDLYFETLAEISMEQNKQMDDTALLSNIGGQLGLFIGCSFLTAFEFLECIIMSTLYHCKRSKSKEEGKKKEWITSQAHEMELGNGAETVPGDDSGNADFSKANASYIADGTENGNPDNSNSKTPYMVPEPVWTSHHL